MDLSFFNKLVTAYKNAPEEFQATKYWQTYEKPIFEEMKRAKLDDLRSGKYDYFKPFGFNEVVYPVHAHRSKLKKTIYHLIQKHLLEGRDILPYSITLRDIREMAFRHCVLYGTVTSSKSISCIQSDSFGQPSDFFTIDDQNYTMHFLDNYLRYCSVNKHLKITGNEVVVELGSGTGRQAEVLKKLYPNLTILCFDLPAQIYLTELHLTNIFPESEIVKLEKTLNWENLSGIEKGKIHFLGNWQWNLLKTFKFDLFWNAASFGEMEPQVVKNYLSYITPNVNWIYLLQSRYGKESSGKVHVNKPITFEDYKSYLPDFSLIEEQDAYRPSKRLNQSGGYFEAIWKKN